MRERVFFAWLSVITLVVSNPVPQIFPTQQYASQQTPLKSSDSIPASYQAAESQTNPYRQYGKGQNQAPIQRNLDGTVMNELMMSNILRNPCLQKILDPNTKLYNQNGREIQRQPNTDATPSVINNYFIVPPEFFNINSNKTEDKFTGVPKRRKNIDRKANLTKAKTTLNNPNDENTKTLNDDDLISNKENNVRRKGGKKKKLKVKPAKIIEENFEMDTNKEQKPEVKTTQKINKQELLKTYELTEISSSIDSPKVEIIEKELNQPAFKNNTSKRRKKVRKRLENDNEEIVNSIPEMFAFQENDSSVNKNMKSVSDDEASKIVSEPQDSSYLTNIESPVDNLESKDLQENIHPTKRAKETRKTRNPNTEKARQKPKEKQNQRITPTPDDMLRNFYPYMYMGNNFNSNGHYPFNFEQFYPSYVSSNSRKNKNNNTRKNQNEQKKKDSIPNEVKVKLKPMKQQTTTTTMKPINEETTDEVKLESTNLTTTVKPMDEKNTNEAKFTSANIKINTELAEPIIDIPIKNLNDIKILEAKKEEEPEIAKKEQGPKIKPVLDPPKQKTVETKANLEMPRTVIEDLHEYITPELGSEDIVPNIYTNGIINDYYPIFHDDSHYADDESYYLRDLEDDRHFYTTDRGIEEPLNRDRRKYDRYEDYFRPNLDIKDRINFRRTYKLRERGKAKFDNDNKSYTKNIENENVKQDFNIEKEDLKQNNIIEDQFQTPPLLEHPDFITTKIEKVDSISDTDSPQAPIYTDFVENILDASDPKPIQYGRLINFDEPVKKIDKITTNNKSQSDRIETVFAKTRVVKYGVTKEEEENTSSLPLFENDGEKFYGDGHTTYVLAKSLGHADDYFW